MLKGVKGKGIPTEIMFILKLRVWVFSLSGIKDKNRNRIEILAYCTYPLGYSEKLFDVFPNPRNTVEIGRMCRSGVNIIKVGIGSIRIMVKVICLH